MRRYFILLILALFLLPLSQAAIMISPGSYSLTFQPNYKGSYEFNFFVDDNALLQVYAGGDLAQYAKLSTDSIRGQGKVIVDISLPASIETPGQHTIIVGARQTPEPGQQGFGLVGNVLGQIQIFVPYPGQYAIFDFSATSANAGQNVTFSGDVNNLGREPITGRAFADVYLDKTKVTTVDLGTFNLDASSKQDFSTQMDTQGMKAGTYTAIGNLIYGDNHLAQQNATFRLGELKVAISNYTSVFQRNKINRVELQVDSHWNDPIQGVYANVTIEGYPISFLTPTISLQGFGSGTLTGFFDTTNLNDTFDAAVTLNYEGKSDYQVLHMTLEKQTNYMLIGLVAAIAVIALLIIVVTVLLRRRKTK